MEHEPRSPQQREKDLVASYAISLYEFMEAFPLTQDSDEQTMRYAEWFAGDSLVQIYQFDKDYTVIVSSSGPEVVTLQLMQDYAEYAEFCAINTRSGLIIEQHTMDSEDWTHFYTLIEQYDAFAVAWPRGQ